MLSRSAVKASAVGFAILICAGCGGSPAIAQNAPPLEADGLALPLPDPEFRGRIGQTIEESTPDFPKQVAAPPNAPNVLLILLDDVGFGHAGTFGGAVATPTMDRLAAEGLRYNQFHTTGLCSPTRAALLTGRNHHSAGTGVAIEMSTGFPGYTGIVPNSAAGLPEVLRENGYATAAFGKWHNTPENEISPAGPFDRWPTGRIWGFDYFYGFMAEGTSQYYPVLYRNTWPVPQPKTPEQGYHLTEDLVDEAAGWLDRIKATNPNKPWFIYFSTGAIHAPHHAPLAYREKYRGRFDRGWDRYREETIARQKQLGVVPANAVLTPRPDEIPAWDDVPGDAKPVYLRLMENYSGFLEHTDHEIGRLIGLVARTGDLDNTLVILILGDSGASAEGGLDGTINATASLNGVDLGLHSLIDRLDDIGGPMTEPNIPVGWAWAANTPFKWTKQVASHLGGTRNGMIVRWPKGIAAKGGLRSQFHHAIDIAPTVLDAAGIPEPRTVNGVQQKPIEGVSIAYTFANASEPSRRTVQYFEMLGNRALYKDGWLASARHGRLPWQKPDQAGSEFDDDMWELYNLTEDFTQSNDVAAKYPGRAREMRALFREEASRHGVLPLDDRTSDRLDPAPRPNAVEGMRRITYGPGSTNIGEPQIPNIHNVPFSVLAEVVVEGGAKQEGVVAALGGIAAGWSLYVKNGTPIFAYNFFGIDRYRIRSSEELPAGISRLRVDVIPLQPGEGKPAKVVMSINGRKTGDGVVERTVPFRFGVEPFDIGMDNVSPVSDDYFSPFKFTGQIRAVIIELQPPGVELQGTISRAIR